MSGPNNNWITCKPSPFTYFARLLWTGNGEFILVPQKGIDDSGTNIPDGIYKYNSIANDWIKIVDYDQDFVSTYHTCVITPTKRFIYLCNAQSQLLKIDLNTKKK
eukprot:850812_1